MYDGRPGDVKPDQLLVFNHTMSRKPSTILTIIAALWFKISLIFNVGHYERIPMLEQLIDSMYKTDLYSCGLQERDG